MESRSRLAPTAVSAAFSLVMASLALVATQVEAQSLDLDVALNQSFTSLDVLDSPTGFSVGVTGHRVFGPMGVQVGYRRLSEYDQEIPRTCGFASCTQGPFDRSYALRTLRLGLFVDMAAPLNGEIGVGVSGSLSWQEKRLEHLAGGESFDDAETGPDRGLGVQADWRFGPLWWRLHPFVFAQYERIAGTSECLADAACFDARYVTSLAVGLAWRME